MKGEDLNMEMIERVSEAAKGKLSLLNKGKGRYLVSSILAGMFIGFGVILMSTVGGILNEASSPFSKIAMGVSFAMALSLVIMAGADLFTGNNLVMSIGYLNKDIKAIDVLRIWFFSYAGNLIGSMLVSFIFAGTGLASGTTGKFFTALSEAKMNAPFIQLFSRAVLCNILVCLAVWCGIKLKEETAKLIMIFWCIYGFVVSGFEHSVANMTLFSTALMIPHGAAVTLEGFAYNLSVVTLGNMVGGIIFVAAAYFYILKD